MTQYPAWKVSRCVHCAAGLPMREGSEYSHFNEQARAEFVRWELVYPLCTAPDSDKLITELEQKLAEATQTSVNMATLLRAKTTDAAWDRYPDVIRDAVEQEYTELRAKLAGAKKDTKRLEAMVAGGWRVSACTSRRPVDYGVWRGSNRITPRDEYPEDWRAALDEAMEQPK